MKRILITGAGGAPSTNFVRSLRDAPEPFYLIGVDGDPYYLQRAETDERYLIPFTSDPQYMDVLLDVVAQTRPQLIYSQPDQEIAVTAAHRERLHAAGVRTFLPALATIEACQDKHRSQELWEAAGIKVPRARLLSSDADLEAACAEYGLPIWLRATYSPGGGRGAFKAETLAQARGWLSFNAPWEGQFQAAECLTPRSVTWMAVYHRGRLVACQSRERKYWEFANRAPSGVTGITGTGVTCSDPALHELALRCVAAIDEAPHGIFSVDLCYDADGTPNPTEINIGRFFTTHYFFTRAGLNLPYLFVQLAFDELEPAEPLVNPLTDGLAWVRGMDTHPTLTTMDAIEGAREDLAARQARLARP